MCARYSPLVPALAAIVANASAQSTPRLDSSLLASVKWRSIGPVNTSGRIDDFTVARVTGQPDAIYVATASGGVVKQTNSGTSWAPIFDRVNAMMSIGAIAVAPNNPRTRGKHDAASACPEEGETAISTNSGSAQLHQPDVALVGGLGEGDSALVAGNAEAGARLQSHRAPSTTKSCDVIRL
jgi:hypothetical protein